MLYSEIQNVLNLQLSKWSQAFKEAVSERSYLIIPKIQDLKIDQSSEISGYNLLNSIPT